MMQNSETFGYDFPPGAAKPQPRSAPVPQASRSRHDCDRTQTVAGGEAAGVTQPHHAKSFHRLIEHTHLAGADFPTSSVLNVAGLTRAVHEQDSHRCPTVLKGL